MPPKPGTGSGKKASAAAGAGAGAGAARRVPGLSQQPRKKLVAVQISDPHVDYEYTVGADS